MEVGERYVILSHLIIPTHYDTTVPLARRHWYAPQCPIGSATARGLALTEWLSTRWPSHRAPP
jgi:hypothetical protein